MINCSDNTYYIYHTDSDTGFIAIPKSALDQTSLDISLVGKTRLEYGQVLNENLLHLLERFASSSTSATPEETNTYLLLLQNPVVGQLWYNNANKTMNVCTSVQPINWEPILSSDYVAGNSGLLSDGEYIPLPISPDGYEFQESECVWNVSPLSTDLENDVVGINVSADNRLVVCKFTTSSGEYRGLVNYIIIGIKGTTSPTPVT